MKTKLTMMLAAGALLALAVLGGTNVLSVVGGNPLPPGSCPPFCSSK